MGRSSDLAKLFARVASQTDVSLVQMATTAEFLARSATNKALTPAILANRPCFGANKASSDQTGIADATVTKVTFTTEAYDVGSLYDAPNSRWTPPAGPVLLHSRMSISGTWAAGSGITYVTIKKNGVDAFFGAPNISPGANGNQLQITELDNANGTDYYEMAVYMDVSSGTGQVTAGAGVSSYWWGVWLG